MGGSGSLLRLAANGNKNCLLWRESARVCVYTMKSKARKEELSHLWTKALTWSALFWLGWLSGRRSFLADLWLGRCCPCWLPCWREIERARRRLERRLRFEWCSLYYSSAYSVCEERRRRTVCKLEQHWNHARCCRFDAHRREHP